MPRPPRDLDSSEWFHVFNKGSDSQDIFSLVGDHDLFESLAGRAAQRTGVEIHAYALMSNHFHLLVHTPDGGLSEFVRLTCARYAAAYNQRTQRCGPVFTGRFGSVPVLDDAHLLTEARYVERNPLAFVAPAALPAYRHSSLGCYLGKRAKPAWLHTDFLSALFTADEYMSFVLEPHPSDSLPLGHLPPVAPIDPVRLIAAVNAVTGVDPTEQRGPARNLATAMSLDLRIATVPELTAIFGLSPAGVRQAARRGRIAVDTDLGAVATRDRIVECLRAA